MFNWRWKWVLGETWGIVIDIAVVFLGVGITFLVGAKLSDLVTGRLIDATTNNFIQVTASYVQWVNGYVISVCVLVIGASLAFIVISRLMARWISQRY